METQPKSFLETLSAWIKNSTSLKIALIGILILLLLIPSGMIVDLIRERTQLRDKAIAEVSSKWGNPQTLAGPVVSVPFTKKRLNQEGKVVEETEYVHFLPSHLDIKGKLNPKRRNRGIYWIMLYQTQLHIKGSFNGFSVETLPLPEGSELQWDKALISMGLSDLRGVNQTVLLKWKGEEKEMGSGLATADLFSTGLSVPISIDPKTTGKTDFEFTLDCNGSQSLRFCPMGKTTQIQLESSWSNPSFMGSFLPKEKTIGPEGFKANWKVLDINRNYPQQGIGRFIPHAAEIEAITNPELEPEDAFSSFGVRLFLPVDEYQQTTRSAKYASMFIFLTFLCFFFVETLNGRKIHPIQYLLIGFAVVLFYVLLLSLSEHIPFAGAYWIASVLITLLIVFYAWNMLKSKKLTAWVGLLFLILYGFFYSLLQLEDYALLAGSFGLLSILATVMYLTRKINWYDLSQPKS